MTERLDLRPVIAWDVDGVIRVREGYTDLPLIQKEITFYRDDYPREYHGQPRWDKNGESHGTDSFSPDAVSLLKLIDSEDLADQVLATTWQGWANTYFGGPLDLPELPVAVRSIPAGQRYHAHCSPDWKSEQLGRQFDGRPLLWIDDNPTDRPHEDFLARRLKEDRGITAFYQTDWTTGIVADDVERILEWIRDASSEEGQEKLRAQYAADLAEEQRIRDEAEAHSKRVHEVYELVLTRAQSIWPDQVHLVRDIALAGRHEHGLSAETLRSTFRRHSILADPVEMSERLRVEGFHKQYDWQ